MKVFVILVLFLVSGCYNYSAKHDCKDTFVQSHSTILYSLQCIIKKIDNKQNVNEEEVIRLMGYPNKKFQSSEGKIAYIYGSAREISNNTTSTGLLTRVKKIKIEKFICIFIFNENGNIENYMYDDQSLGSVTKYDTVTFINKQDISTLPSGFAHLKIGEKKGKIFRILGKPEYVDERNGSEIWYYMENSYPLSKIYYAKNGTNFNFYFIDKIYYFEIKYGKLARKYIFGACKIQKKDSYVSKDHSTGGNQ